MKKSTLALSVAAAIGSFGLVGNAFAIGTLGVGSAYSTITAADASTAITAATSLVRNPDGIGHQLIVPYYSVQDSNTTLLNIANTDTVNAKIVKVRFRGAANSDDVFDFQLLMSPGDIWAGGLTQDPTTGVAKLKAYDNTCTLPSSVRRNVTLDKDQKVIDTDGSRFVTTRVDPTPTAGSSANETREGYIEIINMADIPPNAYNLSATAAKGTTLYGTIKHAARVAACNDDVLADALMRDYADAAAANQAAPVGFVKSSTNAYPYSMTAPTGGLTADWVILNQTKVAAWSGTAAALEARASGVKAAGNLVFWPQIGGSPANDAALAARTYTADPLFVTKVVAIQNYDLPDLSTPYLLAEVTAGAPAHARIDALTSELAVASITNQYVTKEISGVTDFLFSQPTRRYSVGVNYKATTSVYATTGTTASPVFRNALAADNAHAAVGADGKPATTTTAALNQLSGYGSPAYWYEVDTVTGLPKSGSTLAMVNRQVCLTSVGLPAFTDREESTTPGAFIISPNTTNSFALCGEAAIASVNSGGVVAGSALSASVVRNDITFATGYDVGSATFSTGGLPILSGTFMRVANGSTFYGFTIPSKVTRSAH